MCHFITETHYTPCNAYLRFNALQFLLFLLADLLLIINFVVTKMKAAAMFCFVAFVAFTGCTTVQGKLFLAFSSAS